MFNRKYLNQLICFSRVKHESKEQKLKAKKSNIFFLQMEIQPLTRTNKQTWFINTSYIFLDYISQWPRVKKHFKLNNCFLKNLTFFHPSQTEWVTPFSLRHVNTLCLSHCLALHTVYTCSAVCQSQKTGSHTLLRPNIWQYRCTVL
jgi:hypothetical protein